MDNITFVLMLALNFSQMHDYHLGDVGFQTYTCSDYSKDLVLLLRSHNFTSYPMLGWVNHKYHAWVGIEINGAFYNIESQTGEIVYPEGEFYKYARRGVARGLF